MGAHPWEKSLLEKKAWPWPVLTMSMKRTQALPLFWSTYGDFGHAAIDSPESVAENQKTMLLTFDLTLTMYVIFWENFKYWLESSWRELSIAASRVPLRSFVPELTGGGGDITPPPGDACSVGDPGGARAKSRSSFIDNDFSKKKFYPWKINKLFWHHRIPLVGARWMTYMMTWIGQLDNLTSGQGHAVT